MFYGDHVALAVARAVTQFYVMVTERRSTMTMDMVRQQMNLTTEDMESMVSSTASCF